MYVFGSALLDRRQLRFVAAQPLAQIVLEQRSVNLQRLNLRIVQTALLRNKYVCKSDVIWMEGEDHLAWQQ